MNAYHLQSNPRSLVANGNPWFYATALVAILWTVVFSYYSIYLHANFKASIDSAFHAQLLENLARGHFFRTSFMPTSFAGNHFWPGMYLFVPIWRIWGYKGMYIAQAIAVAAGAFPAFSICMCTTKKAIWSFLISVAYLFCPTVASGVLFDFHFELISISFSLFAVLGALRGKWWSLAPLIVALSLYEVNCFVWPFIGLLLWVDDKRNRRVCLSMAVFSLVYGLIAIGVISPAFRRDAIPHVWNRYEHLGVTPILALKNLVSHPFASIKASIDHHDIASTRLLFAFGLLPIVGIRRLLPALPLWLMLALSNSEMSVNIRFGYFAPIVPVLVLASAYGIATMKSSSQLSYVAMTSFLASGIIWSIVTYQINKPQRRHPFDTRHNKRELETALLRIPYPESVSADWHLLPSIQVRSSMLPSPVTELPDGTHVDYIFVDLAENNCKNSGWTQSIKKAVIYDDYAPVFFDNDVAILAHGVSSTISKQFLDRLSFLHEDGKLP